MTVPARYFSVKSPVKMLGSRFVPSVCYRLDDTLALAVEELERKGEAKVFGERVRFVNGSPVSAQRAVAPAKTGTSSELPEYAPVLFSVSDAGNVDSVITAPRKRGSKRRTFD